MAGNEHPVGSKSIIAHAQLHTAFTTYLRRPYHAADSNSYLIDVRGPTLRHSTPLDVWLLCCYCSFPFAALLLQMRARVTLVAR
jgi:hypothetical protein